MLKKVKRSTAWLICIILLISCPESALPVWAEEISAQENLSETVEAPAKEEESVYGGDDVQADESESFGGQKNEENSDAGNNSALTGEKKESDMPTEAEPEDTAETKDTTETKDATETTEAEDTTEAKDTTETDDTIENAAGADNAEAMEAPQEQIMTETEVKTGKKIRFQSLRIASASGEYMDSDAAYIAEFEVDSMKDGSAGWDQEAGPGNDTGDENQIVRSFDSVNYTLRYKTALHEGLTEEYHSGRMAFRFTLPVTSQQAVFDTAAMGWMDQEADHYWKVTEEDGKQVLTCYKLLEPIGENPTAIPGEGTVSVVVNVKAMKNKEVLQPVFEAWMEHNREDDVCSDHGFAEKKKIIPPEVKISAALKLNVQLQEHDVTMGTLETVDFSQGNEKAAYKDESMTSVTGRMNVFGITLQLYNDEGKGLKGLELPDADAGITFRLNFASEYQQSDGKKIPVTDAYTPLIWTYKPNGLGDTADGRALSDYASAEGALWDAPRNSLEAGETAAAAYSCYQGGDWSMKQSGAGAEVKVTGFAFDVDQFPSRNTGSGATAGLYYPADGTVQNIACFSAGAVYLLQPFTDRSGNQVKERYGAGFFNVTVTDDNLRAISVSGQPPESGIDNSNQQKNSDDVLKKTYMLAAESTFSQYQQYYVSNSYGSLAYSEGYVAGSGRAWAYPGDSVAAGMAFYAAAPGEGDEVLYGFNILQKIDSSKLKVETIVERLVTIWSNGGEATFLYAAKPDGSGWENDAELKKTSMEKLVYYESLEDLEKDGKTCVGMLLEMRWEQGFVSQTKAHFEFPVQLTVRDTEENAGKVAMISHEVRTWTRATLKRENIAFSQDGTAVDGLAAALPSLAGNNPESPVGLPKYTGISFPQEKYEKAVYNDSGYAGGHTGGLYWGDSLYIVPYTVSITKDTAQQNDDSAASEGKNNYDMDKNQRIVDYVLKPSIKFGVASETPQQEKTADIVIVDTLDQSLHYMEGTSRLGGTYMQNTSPWKEGAIDGGKELEPVQSRDENGAEILTWTIQNWNLSEQLPPLYYSAVIGDPTDIRNDVSNMQEIVNTVSVSATGDHRTQNEKAGNVAQDSIRVIKLSASSMSKTVDRKRNELTDEIGYSLYYGNGSDNPIADALFVDAMPYHEDSAGSNIHGTYELTEWKLDTSGIGGSVEKVALYYTEDLKYRGIKAEDITAEEIETKWEKAQIASDGTAEALNGRQPSAFALLGEIGGGQLFHIHISLRPKTDETGERPQAGDIYINTASNEKGFVSVAEARLAERSLSGTVWIDADRNGLMGAEESKVSGCSVRLLDDENKVVTNLFGEACKTVTDENGFYVFYALPAGTYRIEFADGENFCMADYRVTQANEGSDEETSINSKADDCTIEDEKLKNASIAGIRLSQLEAMKSEKEMVIYQNLGLYSTVSESEKTVYKKWEDAGDQDGKRPDSILVQLFADGEKYGNPVALDASHNWTYRWEKLPDKKNGREILYTVKEISAVDGYETSYSGDTFTITNAHEPEKTKIPVEKGWKDDGNRAEIRPASVTVRLLADGKDTGKTVTLNAENQWKDVFADLDKYKEKKEIVYTVQEDCVDGYETSISGSAESGFVITNMHRSENDGGSEESDGGNAGSAKKAGGGNDGGRGNAADVQNGGAQQAENAPALTPQTSDSSNPLLWGMLMIAAALCITTLAVINGKRRKKRKR